MRDKLVGTKSNDIDVALETIIRKKTNNKTRKRSSNEIEEKSDQQNTEHAKVDNEDETPQVTGELFAKWLQQEIEKTNQVNVSSGADESEPAEAHIASRVATIKTNPAKSKHLETATMRINDFELDIVALRHETYTHSQGRIPKIIPGTPLQGMKVVIAHKARRLTRPDRCGKKRSYYQRTFLQSTHRSAGRPCWWSE